VVAAGVTVFVSVAVQVAGESNSRDTTPRCVRVASAPVASISV
jgi:hypothetical protein